jgi:hypothetical protein
LIKAPLLERILYRLFHRRYNRLSEYTTDIAIISGTLEAALNMGNGGPGTSCVIDAHELLEKLAKQIYRDMDSLLGFRRKP